MRRAARRSDDRPRPEVRPLERPAARVLRPRRLPRRWGHRRSCRAIRRRVSRAGSAAMPGRVIVVGLGPAGADHLLPAARAALVEAHRRFVRTRRHPAVDELEAEGMRSQSFDEVYDTSPDLEHRVRADRRRRARRGGAPTRSCTRCPGARRSPSEPSVSCVNAPHAVPSRRVVPGLSFADLAWVRLGVDPMDGDARVVDGRAIDDAELAGPLLDRAVRQPARAVRREARAARAPRARHAGHRAATARSPRRAA